jgi:hypothetical protein
MGAPAFRFFRDDSPATLQNGGGRIDQWADPSLAMAWAREALRRIDAYTPSRQELERFREWYVSPEGAGFAWAQCWRALNTPPVGVIGLVAEHDGERLRGRDDEPIKIYSAKPWAEASLEQEDPWQPEVNGFQQKLIDDWVAAHGAITGEPRWEETGEPYVWDGTGQRGDFGQVRVGVNDVPKVVWLDSYGQNPPVMVIPDRWRQLSFVYWLHGEFALQIREFLRNSWSKFLDAHVALLDANAATMGVIGVPTREQARVVAKIARVKTLEMRATVTRNWAAGGNAAGAVAGALIGLIPGVGVILGPAVAGIIGLIATGLSRLVEPDVEVWRLPLADVIVGGHSVENPPTAKEIADLGLRVPEGYTGGAVPQGWPAPLDPEPIGLLGIDFGEPYSQPGEASHVVSPEPARPAEVPLNAFRPHGPGFIEKVQHELQDNPVLELVAPSWEQPGNVNNPVVIDVHPVDPTPTKGWSTGAKIALGLTLTTAAVGFWWLAQPKPKPKAEAR